MVVVAQLFISKKKGGMLVKIFISGSTGFVGTNLTRELQKLPIELFYYKRGQDIKKEVQKFQPDIIFHLAAELHDEKKMAESNVGLTLELLEGSKDIPYRAFVNLGTSSEYGKKNEPIKETDVLRPETLYGLTKANATIACQNFAIRYGKPIITLRPFSVYGIGEPSTRLIPTAIRCCLEKKTMTLGQGVHDFIYVDDVILAMWMMAGKERERICGEIINLGSGIQTSNQEVVDIVSRICGKKIKTKRVDRFRDYDTDCWVANIDRALQFGWCPRILLEEGIERMVDDYKTKSREHKK